MISGIGGQNSDLVATIDRVVVAQGDVASQRA